MNPGFYIDLTSYQAGRTYIDLVYTSGASGAVPSPLGSVNYGVASVAHGSTGVLTVTFNGQAHGLLNWNLNVKQASYSASGAYKVQVTAYDLVAKTVTLLCTTAAGVAVDPASGDELHLTFIFQRYGN